MVCHGFIVVITNMSGYDKLKEKRMIMKQTCNGTPRLHITIVNSLEVNVKDSKGKPVTVENVEEECDWYEKITLSNVEYFVCLDNTEDVLTVSVYLDDCYENEVCCSVERLSDVV